MQEVLKEGADRQRHHPALPQLAPKRYAGMLRRGKCGRKGALEPDIYGRLSAKITNPKQKAVTTPKRNEHQLSYWTKSRLCWSR